MKASPPQNRQQLQEAVIRIYWNIVQLEEDDGRPGGAKLYFCSFENLFIFERRLTITLEEVSH